MSLAEHVEKALVKYHRDRENAGWWRWQSRASANAIEVLVPLSLVGPESELEKAVSFFLSTATENDRRYGKPLDDPSRLRTRLAKAFNKWNNENRLVWRVGTRRPEDVRPAFEQSVPCLAVGRVSGETFHESQRYFEARIGIPPNLQTTNQTKQEELVDLGIKTVKAVRNLLYYGPLNNRAGLPTKILNRPVNPKKLHFISTTALQLGIDNIDPQFHWYSRKEPLPTTRNIAFQLGLLARITRVQRGGVCSYIAGLTHAILTTTAPGGTTICHVSNSADHEFIAISAKGTAWIVVDPWTHYSWVIPWEANYFRREDVNSYSITVITEKTKHFFGFRLPKGDLRKVIREASALAVDTSQHMDHEFRHPCNLGECLGTNRRLQDHSNGCPSQLNRNLLAAGPSDWGDDP